MRLFHALAFGNVDLHANAALDDTRRIAHGGGIENDVAGSAVVEVDLILLVAQSALALHGALYRQALAGTLEPFAVIAIDLLYRVFGLRQGFVRAGGKAVATFGCRVADDDLGVWIVRGPQHDRDSVEQHLVVAQRPHIVLGRRDADQKFQRLAVGIAAQFDGGRQHRSG